MADKFDKLMGRFKVSLNGREYPFSMTVRQRGIFSNLRAKFDSENMITFLFERFIEGYMNDQKNLGKQPTDEEVGKYQEELANFFLANYDNLLTEVLIELGVTTRQKLKEMEEKYANADFLSEMARKQIDGVQPD